MTAPQHSWQISLYLKKSWFKKFALYRASATDFTFLFYMQLSIWFSSNKSLFYTAEHYTRLFSWRNIWTGTMPFAVEAISACVEYEEGSVYCTNCTETGSLSKECWRWSVCGENMWGEEGTSKKYRQLISWWNKRTFRCIFFTMPNIITQTKLQYT
jgi:hypothetical protein